MRIRVYDLETSQEDGSSETEVVEIGWCDVVSRKINFAGDPVWWEVADHGSMLVKPTKPITPQASAIHHITDEDVAGARTWSEAWALASQPPSGETIDYLAAHSAKFERGHIADEMTGGLQWLCTYKCGLRLWPEAKSHSNQALRYLRRPIGLDRQEALFAHRAGPDAYVTAFHLRDQLDLVPVQTLLDWSAKPAVQVWCHIGKQRGMRWRDVDDGFLLWILDKDFDEDVLFTARFELERREEEERKERERFEAELVAQQSDTSVESIT